MIKDNVRKHCKRAGISQSELARRIRVSRQRFSRMMNDPYLMTFGVMGDAASALGCTLADLQGFDGQSITKINSIMDILND